MSNRKYHVERLPDSFSRPARDLLGYRIEKGDDSLRVGDNHGVADAAQGGVQQIAEFRRIVLAFSQLANELFLQPGHPDDGESGRQEQAERDGAPNAAFGWERAVSALSSLDAESRATCEARRLALETEVARTAERSTDQFRKGMKAFLYSCLVAAVSAVDEHSKSTLDGLVKDNGKTLFEAGSDSRTKDDPEIIPDTDIDPLTH